MDLRLIQSLILFKLLLKHLLLHLVMHLRFVRLPICVHGPLIFISLILLSVQNIVYMNRVIIIIVNKCYKNS